jgi:hypothetical protein
MMWIRLDRLSPLALALWCGVGGGAAGARAQSPPEAAGHGGEETLLPPFRPLWVPDQAGEETGARQGLGLLAGFPSLFPVESTDKGRQSALMGPPVLNDRAGGAAVMPGGWRKEEALGLPFAGPVFLFGELKAREDSAASPNSKIICSTGLGWKLPIHTRAELAVSAGPEVTYLGALGTTRAPDRSALPLQSQLLRLDVQCRCPLVGPLGLECQEAACPALSTGERDRLNQDLRVVCPVGQGGQLRIGAKRSWEVGGDPRPGADAIQFYGGIRLGW